VRDDLLFVLEKRLPGILTAGKFPWFIRRRAEREARLAALFNIFE
jgi:hypothetical protein